MNAPLFAHTMERYTEVTDTLSCVRTMLRPLIDGLQEANIDYHDHIRPIVAAEYILRAAIDDLEEIRLFLVKGGVA
jgi:hypothetical protein